MKVTTAITKAFLHAQRKATPPAAGTTKYEALLAIADSMQKMWAAEPDVEWNSLYELVNIGNVTATDEFDLDDSIDTISKREGDFILLKSGTLTTTVKIITPNQLYEYRYQLAAARVGSTLKFSTPFVSTDSTIGYSINVPSIVYPSDITAATNTIQVDDPMWLVYMMAAEFCRTDTVKGAQYDNLLQMADLHMQKMKAANGGQNDAVILNWQPDGISW
jgi:hypothetical protein